MNQQHTLGGRRRRRTAAAAIALVATAGVAFAPASAGAQSTDAQAEAANRCEKQNNDTLDKLLECVTIDGVRAHQFALQEIADANGGNRVSGSTGYNKSANYVVRQLKKAGYKVNQQFFKFDYYEQLSPSTFEQLTPTPTTYVQDTDFSTMSYSGSGDVTGTIQAVDLLIPPPPAGGSTSGCEVADFAGFTAGNVALVQRGTCDFAVKAANAQGAGASAVIIFNEGNTPERSGVIFGTLGGGGYNIPVLDTTFAIGEALAAAPGTTVHMTTDTFVETRRTSNVIADLVGKRPNRVIQLGAHLDSVDDGPGINDNGSGSAAILEVAQNMAKSKPVNSVRFSFWGAEEAGLVGSAYYVDNLAATKPNDLAKIKAYLNFDMVGSPNFVRFIYDGDESTFEETLVPIPDGSDEIEKIFEAYYDANGLAYEDTAFDGRSDYEQFALYGIPAGGLFTGAEDGKTPEQAAIYGGTAGEPYDPCYHAVCDTFDNVNLDVLDQNSDAIAYAAYTLGFAKDLPFPQAEATALTVAAPVAPGVPGALGTQAA